MLTATLDLASEQGWPAVTVRKVAERIEYSPGMLYEYFDGKEALLTALLQEGYTRLLTEMEPAISAAETIEDRLLAITHVYWCFALALLGAQLILRKNLIRSLMGQQMTLPDPVWNKLNLAWGAFFAAMGALNLYVAFNFPLELWVNFKMFGFLGLMIAFVIAQTAYLSRYLKEPE